MLKKALLTAVAALAITAGATTISTPDANAGGKFHVTFGHGYHGSYGGYYGGYIGPYYDGYYASNCYWKKRRVRISHWHHGYKHHDWVWRSFKVC